MTNDDISEGRVRLPRSITVEQIEARKRLGAWLLEQLAEIEAEERAADSEKEETQAQQQEQQQPEPEDASDGTEAQ